MVAVLGSEGYDLNKFESSLYKETSMHVMAFLVQWFLRRVLKHPTLFLPFLNYFPSDRDMVSILKS